MKVKCTSGARSLTVTVKASTDADAIAAAKKIFKADIYTVLRN